MGAVRDLVERPVTFDYAYNAVCPVCRGITAVTSAQRHNPHVQCGHCDHNMQFGRAVMTLRDLDDPVLDDQTACRTRWYHTSTDSSWPGGAHPMPPAAQDLWLAPMPPEEARRARESYENQALHLGTYESAIESMLRKMRDQGEGGSQFYLYRVALRRHGVSIEQGWRHENSDEVAQVTQAELGAADAVRYLNVVESPGSISLAIRPAAIAAVQGILLPANHVAAPDRLLREVAGIRAEVAQVESTRPAYLDPLEQLRRQHASRRGIPFTRSPTPQQRALLNRIPQLITGNYLPGVARPIQAAFTRALDAWHRAQQGPDDAASISQFASMARTLTHPGEVLQALSDQPVRDVCAAPSSGKRRLSRIPVDLPGSRPREWCMG